MAEPVATPKACVFCQIVAGELPADVVLDEGPVLAFLDRTPLFHGHTLVIPRDHHVTLPDLPGDLLAPLFAATQRLAAVVPAALDGQGSFVAMNNIVSQSVAHLHVHVVPRTKGDGLKGFFWPRQRYRDDVQRAEIAERIRQQLQA